MKKITRKHFNSYTVHSKSSGTDFFLGVLKVSRFSLYIEFYRDVMNRLLKRIVRPNFYNFYKSGKWFLLHNVPAHTSLIITRFLKRKCLCVASTGHGFDRLCYVPEIKDGPETNSFSQREGK